MIFVGHIRVAASLSCVVFFSAIAPLQVPTAPPVPMVTGITSGSPLDLDKLKADGKETVVLKGTNLSGVVSVNLSQSGSQTLAYKPDPINPPDPTKLQFTVLPTNGPASTGAYDLTLDTTGQKGIVVDKKFSLQVIQAPPVPMVTGITSGSPLDLDKLKADGKETVVLKGTNLSGVVSVNLSQSGSQTLAYKPDPINPPDPTKLQFTVLPTNGPASTGAYDLTLDTTGQKGIVVDKKFSLQVTQAPQQVSHNVVGSPSAQTCSSISGNVATKAVLSSLSSGYPETMADMRITGAGLSKYKTAVLCFRLSNGNYLPSDQLIRFDPSPTGNSDGLLAGTLSIFPSALKGDYSIFLTDGSTLDDSKLTFTVRGANNGQYADCPNDEGPVTGNESLYCSEALLDYGQAREVFGKGVADHYIAVEVVVRNIDDNYEYILHDIRLGTTRAVVASIDRQLVRGVAEHSEEFSARAIAVRLTEASASLFSSIAAVLGTTSVINAASVLAGPGVLGLKHVIPDLSIAELNRVNDLSFSAGGIVVAKHSAVSLVAFLSTKIFVPECATNSTLQGCHNSNTVQLDFKDLSTSDLMTFQNGLIVQVAGAHVQEIAQVAVTNVSGSPLDLSKLQTSGKQIVSLNGTGLDAVTAVHLTSGSNTFTFSPITPLNPNKLQFEIDESKAPAAGNYSITLDTSAVKNVQTNLSLAIEPSTAPNITGITKGSPLVLDDLQKAGTETVVLQGNNLESVTAVNITSAGKTLTYKPQATATELQFDILSASPPATGSYTFTIDTPAQKAIAVDSKFSLVVVQSEVKPSVKKIVGSLISLAKLQTDGSETVILQGVNLDSVTAINVVSTGKTVNYKVQASATAVQFDISKSSPPAVGNYTFTLDTSTQKGISVDSSMVLQVTK